MDSYVVRYGVMRYRGTLESFPSSEPALSHGDLIVIETPRGHELATVLCPFSGDNAACDRLANAKGVLRFVRRALPEDVVDMTELTQLKQDDYKRCFKIVTRMKIKLTLALVERILGQERIIVYYVADGRIDFRELVRALAAEFQTKIEMKQIGPRDETRLLADVGDCGREICCRYFLATMPPVSMKLVKLQKSTLDPTKVTGRCGKLKCCLRFEHEYYRELYSQAPPIGRRVKLGQEYGRVVAQELIARRVVVEFEDGRRASVGIDEFDPSFSAGENNEFFDDAQERSNESKPHREGRQNDHEVKKPRRDKR